MTTYIMLIMLIQMDPAGYTYSTPMQEDPVTQYRTLTECESAADTRRSAMLQSSARYPDLGIQDILIRCVSPTVTDLGDPNTI